MPRRSTSLPEARIELAPLIDVVFVLLAFFILALVVTTRLELTEILLPQARAGAQGAEPGASVVLITLDEAGGLRVGDESVALGDLASACREALEASPEAELIVAPDRSAPTGRLLDLMDELGEAGFPDLRILRETPSAGSDGVRSGPDDAQGP